MHRQLLSSEFLQNVDLRFPLPPCLPRREAEGAPGLVSYQGLPHAHHRLAKELAGGARDGVGSVQHEGVLSRGDLRRGTMLFGRATLREGFQRKANTVTLHSSFCLHPLPRFFWGIPEGKQTAGRFT